MLAVSVHCLHIALSLHCSDASHLRCSMTHMGKRLWVGVLVAVEE